MKIQLNEDWSRLFEKYRQDHQHPMNKRCHRIGIPLILSSIPVGATIIGLPLAATMFTVGWGFQFAGHFFEGKKPSFVDDKRSLLIGAMWCFEAFGCKIHEETPLT
jgi:uncharacterized membrane protein YGL010W